MHLISKLPIGRTDCDSTQQSFVCPWYPAQTSSGALQSLLHFKALHARPCERARNTNNGTHCSQRPNKVLASRHPAHPDFLPASRLPAPIRCCFHVCIQGHGRSPIRFRSCNGPIRSHPPAVGHMCGEVQQGTLLASCLGLSSYRSLARSSPRAALHRPASSRLAICRLPWRVQGTTGADASCQAQKL